MSPAQTGALQDPDRVLGKLRGLGDDLAASADPAAQAKQRVVATSLRYLAVRRAQSDYAAFRAAGYPSGSGLVESANKLVVEARLKGAGMHRARPHVDPLLALRNIVCSDRWAEAWPQLLAESAPPGAGTPARQTAGSSCGVPPRPHPARRATAVPDRTRQTARHRPHAPPDCPARHLPAPGGATPSPQR